MWESAGKGSKLFLPDPDSSKTLLQLGCHNFYTCDAQYRSQAIPPCHEITRIMARHVMISDFLKLFFSSFPPPIICNVVIWDKIYQDLLIQYSISFLPFVCSLNIFNQKTQSGIQRTFLQTWKKLVAVVAALADILSEITLFQGLFESNILYFSLRMEEEEFKRENWGWVKEIWGRRMENEAFRIKNWGGRAMDLG